MAVCSLTGGRLMGPNMYPEAPDGGWGWLVAVAFFVVEVFTYGTIKSFGIFLQDIVEEFGETISRVSWIISICVFIMTVTAPLSSVLTNRFGFQPVVMIGGLLIAIGTITTSFTSSINDMYITTGVVAGLGYCLSFLPTVTILSQYFNRRRSLVTTVASTGESFSMFALAPAFSALRDSIGWRYTLVVMGSLQGSIIICGALLRPIIIRPGASQETEAKGLSPKPERALDVVKSKGTNTLDNGPAMGDSLSLGDSGVQSLKDTEESGEEKRTLVRDKGRLEVMKCKEESRQSKVELTRVEEKGLRVDEKKEEGNNRFFQPNLKLLDFSILRESSFIFYSLFGLFATLGFFAPQLYIIELSVNRGVERDHATYMLSTMAVAEVFGRLSIGWILTRRQLRKRKLQVLLSCVTLMTLVLVAFTLVHEFYGLGVCCALYGYFMGTIASTHIPMLAEEDVVGIERMASAAGVYVFIQSFAGLAGPPLGGFLVDFTQNYGSAFYSCAVGMGLGAVFLAFVKPAKRGLCCKKDVINQDVTLTGSENNASQSREWNQERGRDCSKDDRGVDTSLDQDRQEGTAGNGPKVTISV